jgi:hypothetical protein
VSSFDYNAFDTDAFDSNAFAGDLGESFDKDAFDGDAFSTSAFYGVSSPIAAGVGTYTYSGTDATTTVSAPVTVYSFELNAFDEGAFDVNAFLLQASTGVATLFADAGVYTYVGADANVTALQPTAVSAGVGTYTYTGADVSTYPQSGQTATEFTVNYNNLSLDSPFDGNPAFSALVPGDICVYVNTTTPGGITVSMLGNGEFDLGSQPLVNESFDYFIYDISDGTAGTTGTITVLGELGTVAGVGAYTYAGADVTTSVTYKITAETGVYTYAGTDAQTSEQIPPTSDTLGAEVGFYTYAGTDITTRIATILTADAGTYTYSGTDVSLDWLQIMPAEVGTYTYSGSDADIATFFKRAECFLVTKEGRPRPGLSSISWAWFDESDPGTFNAPITQGTAELSSSEALLSVDLVGTVLDRGDFGTLVLRSDDGVSIGAYNLEVV